MSVDKKDFKRVTVCFSPKEYEEMASLARQGIRNMPRQLGFMLKTWLPMALQLCRLNERGTPDHWAVNLWKEHT